MLLNPTPVDTLTESDALSLDMAYGGQVVRGGAGTEGARQPTGMLVLVGLF